MSEAVQQEVVNEAPSQPEPPKVRFIPRAQPYNINLIVDASVIDPKLDAFWESKKDSIPQHVFKRAAKGFRNWTRERVIKIMGGEVQFYRPVFIEYVGDLGQKYDGREILIWGDYTYVKQDTHYLVQGAVYLEPKVTFSEPPPERFSVNAALPSEEDVQAQLDVRLAQYQGQYPIKKEDGSTETPALNDDLAISCGFETFKQMETTLRRDIESGMVREQEQASIMQVMVKLMMCAKIDPAPDLWVQARTNERIAEHRQIFRNDDTIMKVFGARSMQEVFDQLAAQSQHSLIQILVLRQYGFERNIALDGEDLPHGTKSLSNAHIYSDRVKHYILNNLLDSVEPKQETPNESTST